jgi:hypothetical protein
MNERVTFALSIKVRSPFMFQGLVNVRLGVDAACLRSERDRPIIPAEQVRGVLRMAMDVLGGMPAWRAEKNGQPRQGRAPSVIAEAEIACLFGEKSKPEEESHGEHNRPERGCLHFNDLEADREAEPGVTTRIEIDDVLGSVKTGALQVVELVATVGTDVTFSGMVILDADTHIDVTRVETALRKALKIVPAIGAFKSAGFGEVVGSDISIQSRVSVPPAAVSAWPGDETRRAYRVTFDRPILVDAMRLTDNLFVGRDVIPGAAFKGALAERLRAAGVDPERDLTWASALKRLRVSHGFPENADRKPFGFSIPASVLCGYPNNTLAFGDALLAAPQSATRGSDGFVFGTANNPVRGSFPVDWKSKEFAGFADGTRFPRSEMLPEWARIHVQISPDTLIAKDQQLFGMIAKGVRRASKVARAWRVVLDAENVAPECRKALFDLWQAGLGPLGRTNAFATMTEISVSDPVLDAFDGLRRAPPPVPIAAMEDLYAVALITPAILIDPLSKKDERQQYADFWASVCGADLVDLFASRSLAGGYIAIRRRVYGKAYYPFVLTEAGSVFLLQKPDMAKLTELLRFGLQTPQLTDGAGNKIVLSWRNCPYVRENGYGEIACNLVDHAALAQGVTRV